MSTPRIWEAINRWETKMEYVIVFDDGRFVGFGGYCLEYPDAKLFTNKREAEKESRRYNCPSTVISTEEYASK